MTMIPIGQNQDPVSPEGRVTEQATTAHEPVALAKNSPDTRILIALSGGGFRATVFHLGVMRALRDAHLLDRVKAISSVSGGSITAAHLVLAWHQYRNYSADHFRDIERQIKVLTMRGIRKQIVAASSPRKLLKTSHATDLLAAQYESLWGKKQLRQLYSDESVPRLFIMATNLSRHTAYTFFTEDGYTIKGDDGELKIGMESLPVASAVAASSAFPLLFPAYKLKFPSVEAAGASTDCLTDGGVFENLGLTVLQGYVTSQNWSLGKDAVILLSNAGRRIDWDVDTDFSLGAPKALNRALDVMQYWGEKRLLSANVGGLVKVDIQQTITPKKGDRSDPPTTVQQRAASIGTDLAAFSQFEYDFLFDHGYCIAKRAIESDSVLKNFANFANGHTPWATVSGDWEGAEDKLRSDVNWEIPWWTWSRRPLIIMAALVVLAAVALWFALPMIGATTERFTAWLVERQYTDLPQNDIAFQTLIATKAELSPKREELDAPIPFLHPDSISHEANVAIHAARRHYMGTMPGKIVAVCERKQPFGERARSTTRWVRFTGNVRASFGTAYLIDPDQSTSNASSPYREIRLASDSDDSMKQLKGNVEFQTKAKQFFVFVLVLTPLQSKEDLSVQNVHDSHLVLGAKP